MQAALSIPPTTLLPLTPSKNFSQVAISTPKLVASSLVSRRSAIKTAATTSNDASTIDYNSAFSVFPAEACEVIGGDACSAEMYPEAKLKPEAGNDTSRIASEPIEREYLEYNDTNTVFKGEACDDLGGTFCDREYQRGVY